jgi:hypothetical protein
MLITVIAVLALVVFFEVWGIVQPIIALAGDNLEVTIFIIIVIFAVGTYGKNRKRN